MQVLSVRPRGRTPDTTAALCEVLVGRKGIARVICELPLLHRYRDISRTCRVVSHELLRVCKGLV